MSACFASVPFIRRHSAGRTCYALTNRRALVYRQGLFGPTRESYTPLEVSGMRRSDSWLFRGTGDLVFRTVYVVKSSGVSTGVGQRSVKTTHYGFLALPQVREVEKLVRETLIDRFVDFIEHENGKEAYEEKSVAVISENETALGYVDRDAKSATHHPGLLYIYFPRGIAQLRTAYQNDSVLSAGKEEVNAPHSKLKLDLDSA